MTFVYNAKCPICGRVEQFHALDDYASSRDRLHSPQCPYGYAPTRDRALADALFSLLARETVPTLAIHEIAPSSRGISLWLEENCPGLVQSGYFPAYRFGALVDGLRNENMESQTFAAASFDLVVHLDVMEHVFDPFQALRETYRTLRPKGICLFTTPTYEQPSSEQVAFLEEGEVRIVGEPEYHGNPQDPHGSLVTWRFGYDFARLVGMQTRFDVEVRRWYSPQRAIVGPMTEVYILRRQD